MIVRFDSKKLVSNTQADIGIATDPATKTKGAVSEVEMIVGEARRQSIAAMDGQDDIPEGDSEDIKEEAFRDIEEEPIEAGPELTPEGMDEAEKILSQKQKEPVTSTA